MSANPSLRKNVSAAARSSRGKRTPVLESVGQLQQVQREINADSRASELMDQSSEDEQDKDEL